MRHKKNPIEGYSLIEILIVLFIVTLLSIIPVKLLTPSDHRTMLQQHVREVVGELYRIRNVAATMNRPYRLVIDVNAENNFDIAVDFLDLTDNTWKPDQSVPKIDLEKRILQNITDDNAPVDFPLIFPFNSRGIQLNETDNTPTLTPRTVSFSNQRTGGDIISITLNPLGGMHVSDNF